MLGEHYIFEANVGRYGKHVLTFEISHQLAEIVIGQNLLMQGFRCQVLGTQMRVRLLKEVKRGFVLNKVRDIPTKVNALHNVVISSLQEVVVRYVIVI